MSSSDSDFEQFFDAADSFTSPPRSVTDKCNMLVDRFVS